MVEHEAFHLHISPLKDFFQTRPPSRFRHAKVEAAQLVVLDVRKIPWYSVDQHFAVETEWAAFTDAVEQAAHGPKRGDCMLWLTGLYCRRRAESSGWPR